MRIAKILLGLSLLAVPATGEAALKKTTTQGATPKKKKAPPPAKKKAAPTAKKTTAPAKGTTSSSKSALTSAPEPASATPASTEAVALPEPLRSSVPAPVEAPAATTSSESGVSASFDRSPSDETWVELDAGVHVFRRDLTYGTTVTGVRPYELGLAPAPSLDVTVYPGVLVNAVPWLGVHASFERAVGLSSVAQADGSSVAFPTSAQAFSAAAQGRLALGRLTLLGRAGYGQRSFTISDAPGVAKPEVPSVSWGYVLAQGGARLSMSEHLELEGMLGWHQVLSQGELATAAYFPSASGNGFDATFGIGVPMGALHFGAAVDFERYAVDLGGGTSGGTAQDQFLGMRFTVGYRG